MATDRFSIRDESSGKIYKHLSDSNLTVSEVDDLKKHLRSVVNKKTAQAQAEVPSAPRNLKKSVSTVSTKYGNSSPDLDLLSQSQGSSDDIDSPQKTSSDEDIFSPTKKFERSATDYSYILDTKDFVEMCLKQKSC